MTKRDAIQEMMDHAMNGDGNVTKVLYRWSGKPDSYHTAVIFQGSPIFQCMSGQEEVVTTVDGSILEGDEIDYDYPPHQAEYERIDAACDGVEL